MLLIIISPLVGRISPNKQLIKVDFPDPFGPIIKISSPSLTSNETPSKATVPFDSFDLENLLKLHFQFTLKFLIKLKINKYSQSDEAKNMEEKVHKSSDWAVRINNENKPIAAV